MDTDGDEGENNQAFQQEIITPTAVPPQGPPIEDRPGVLSRTSTSIDEVFREILPNIWTRSPYTYKLPTSYSITAALSPAIGQIQVAADNHHEENNGIKDSLPLVDISSTSSRYRPNTAAENSQVQQSWEPSPPDAVGWSHAPVGHYADFYGTEELGGHHYDSSDSEEDTIKEDRYVWGDQKTLFGRIQTQLLEKPSKRVVSKESRKQARNGVRLADVITKVPLSKVWHRFTEFWAIAVFISNVVVASYDIIREANNLHYKVTALVFGLIENIIVVSLWAISKHPRFKNTNNFEQRMKHFQYAENIVHELLIYPLIVINIVGFATEKMYQTPSDAFGWTQLILLVIDFIEIIFTQCVRIYMLYRFTKDILKVIDPDAKLSWCGYSFAAYILQRSFFTFAGNIMLMLVLAAMFGIQVHEDNFTSNDYHLTLESTLLMLCFMIIPTLSLVLFALTNAYWILEILIDLNLQVAGDAEFTSKLKERYGDVVHGAVDFAQKKVPASRERLATLRSTSRTRKALFGVLEIRILLCIFVYEIMVFLGFYFFSGFSSALGNILMKCGLGLILLLANLHLVVLMLLSNVSVAVLGLSVLVYPLTIPLCCKKKYQVLSASDYDDDND